MPGKIHFGAYELDLDAMELRKQGVLVRLQEQPLRVLAILAERPGEIVKRDELQKQIWGNDTFVDFDQSLNKAVNRIREALHDNAEAPQYVETIPRRGYRFVAPVTGIASDAQQQVETSIVASFSPPRKSVLYRWIVGLVFVGAVTSLGLMLWFKRQETPLPREPKHVAAGSQPKLSRDGRLLAYTSTVGGTVQHIWVQQTASGEAAPLTQGADPDFLGEFSPDGTHIVFYSTREGGGIYVSPTLPGEPRLVVRVNEPVIMRFSPDGRQILYFHAENVFTVPVEGGRPVNLTLNQHFKVDNVLWAPSGNKIIFHGVDRNDPRETPHWWIAPVPAGTPSIVQLPHVEKDDFRSVRCWIRDRDGREWIVYQGFSEPEAWKVFRTAISAERQIEQRPEPLTSGTGHLESASMSEDGKLAYSIHAENYQIYEIPTNELGLRVGPTQQLSLGEEGDGLAPSVSRDGRRMVYQTTRPGRPTAIFLKDLRTGTDRFLDEQGHRPGTGDAATAISPDGSTVVFERNCEAKGKWFPTTHRPDCSFSVPATGGTPEQVCELCMSRGFSADGSLLLIQKMDRNETGRKDRISVVDLATKTEKDFLSLPDKDLYHAYFSWDDRWVVFKEVLESSPEKAQILIAPVRDRVAGKKSEWIEVTDTRYRDDKPQFSPDGSTVYFTSTRDGYLCIWAQKLNPITKHPVGSPVAVEHFHNSLGRDADQGASDLSVARDKILINLPQTRSDIWMITLE